MTTQEFFEVWAPPGGLWSGWVKPVLFAASGAERSESLTLRAPDVSWAPASNGQTTIVVDLPGAASVWMGLAFAQGGYRPVPLYNAVPGPPGLALVDVRPILSAMRSATPMLGDLKLPKDAPPAFLLDENRRRGEKAPGPGLFDNRSVSFPSDFPSANLLTNRGVCRALLVQTMGRQPQADLAHTLRRWQEAGLSIDVKELAGGPATACIVAKPVWYRSIWHRLAVLSGLRRNPLGGFGGTLPEPSAG